MHDARTISDPSRCSNCQRPLQPAARFCPSCGQPITAAAGAPPAAAPRRAATSFDRNWAEIKYVMWLFGLLLASSFTLGLATRVAQSVWPEIILTGIDASLVAGFASTQYPEILSLLRLPRPSIRRTFEMAGVAVVFFVVMHAYFTLIVALGVPLLHVTAQFQKAGLNTASILLMTSVIPAVVEELAFRGVIQSALEHVLGRGDAWIVQAALFSVLHLLPVAFPSHFVMGLCFGYMRLRSGSLYPCMMLHASWNALVVYQELYAT